jgi:spoIIIJ-associated protein
MREDKEYKDFTGKNLDEAMSAACAFFGVERGKLEIEILHDAKAGIFGLVGAKKAAVRARRVHIEGINLRMGEDPSSVQPEQREKAPARYSAKGQTEKDPQPRTKTARAGQPPHGGRPSFQTEGEGGAEPRPRRQQARREEEPEAARAEEMERPAPSPEPEENFQEVPLETMDQELLRAAVLEAVSMLTRPVAGESGKDLEISGGKVRVRIDSGENSGLLIGREGQTLAALQYLTGCIVSRRMNASVRVQIDTGDYRERQTEKLRALALDLAGKVKANGRPQSTRPLSAYQRRIIHMTLQDMPEVQTHSKGEGGLKRVIIVPRRNQ